MLSISIMSSSSFSTSSFISTSIFLQWLQQPPMISLSITALIITIFLYLLHAKKAPNLPPGPRGLPIVGSIPFIDRNLHRWFGGLARIHGPVMSVWLGSKLVVVVTSPAAAQEVLRDQDSTFANHDIPAAVRTAFYNGSDFVFCPNGPQWRTLRKVCVRELLSPQSIEAMRPLRRREVRRAVKVVKEKAGELVEVRELAFVTTLNLMMTTMWGGRLHGEQRERVGKEFRVNFDAFGELLMKPNISDFFPAIARFDLQAIERRLRKIMRWLDKVLDPIIDKRVKDGESEDEDCTDFLQVMVELLRRGDTEVPLTIVNVKALVMNLFGGGTETTSTTVEWAMAELLNSPPLMKAVQEELDQVVGKDNIVEESHIPQLRYLHAVVKEVLRLYPPLPVLFPHSPSETTTVNGYTVPKGTAIFINAWAIQTDPSNWEDPLKFKPERFLRSMSEPNQREHSGRNFNFIPFGSGRRICAGMALGEKMVTYMLATFLHSFNWHLPPGIGKVDLDDQLSSNLKMAKPLVAVPVPRLSREQLYF